jgi:hypothetical protein
MISYLEANQGSAKWLVAVANSNSAASIELQTGRSVISMWGFTGSDPAMTAAKLQQLVASGELKYVMLGGGMGGAGFGGPGGGNSASSQVQSWVQQHCTAVSASAYGGSSSSSSGSSSTTTTSTSSLYACTASSASSAASSSGSTA